MLPSNQYRRQSMSVIYLFWCFWGFGKKTCDWISSIPRTIRREPPQWNELAWHCGETSNTFISKVISEIGVFSPPPPHPPPPPPHHINATTNTIHGVNVWGCELEKILAMPAQNDFDLSFLNEKNSLWRWQGFSLLQLNRWTIQS